MVPYKYDDFDNPFPEISHKRDLSFEFTDVVFFACAKTPLETNNTATTAIDLYNFFIII